MCSRKGQMTEGNGLEAKGGARLDLLRFSLSTSYTAAPCPRRGELSPGPEPGQVFLSLFLTLCRGPNGCPTKQKST